MDLAISCLMPRQSFWAGQGFELDIDRLLSTLGDPPILSIKKCAAKSVSRSPEGAARVTKEIHHGTRQMYKAGICKSAIQMCRRKITPSGPATEILSRQGLTRFL